MGRGFLARPAQVQPITEDTKTDPVGFSHRPGQLTVVHFRREVGRRLIAVQDHSLLIARQTVSVVGMPLVSATDTDPVFGVKKADMKASDALSYLLHGSDSTKALKASSWAWISSSVPSGIRMRSFAASTSCGGIAYSWYSPVANLPSRNSLFQRFKSRQTSLSSPSSGLTP